MKLYKLILTKNNCYKAGKKHKVRGIMVHSTGANNPWLKRYVGPDDGRLGVNAYGNHWNQPRPEGIEICCHAFIGKLADGTVATYQTLPWDMAGWHSGTGSKGHANNANNTGYIGFEICEDGLQSKAYLEQVYAETVDLCVYLCQKYGLAEKDIICHSEGHTRGIASAHADVMHWWPRHGRSMDGLRADVKARLAAEAKPQEEAKQPAAAKPAKLYRVQVGAFTVKANAEAMVSSAKEAGFADAYIKKQGKLYRVQVGAFKVKDNAEAYLASAKKAGFADAYIVEA